MLKEHRQGQRQTEAEGMQDRRRGFADQQIFLRQNVAEPARRCCAWKRLCVVYEFVSSIYGYNYSYCNRSSLPAQEDLDEMSEFLVLKSTETQKAEGVTHPVDTAYIDDRDGMPILKAVFDVSQFRPEDVHLDASDDQLVLIARGTDDSRECSIFRKTMIRKLDLPKYVEAKMMHCELSKDGVLTVEMPFHLPAQRRPSGPSVVPIITDDDGRRRIRFSAHIGPDFTADDVQVELLEGNQLQMTAFYDAEIGYYGSQVTQRRLQRTFRLPQRVKVDAVHHSLSPDGFLKFEIVLVKEGPYKCDVTTEELVGEDKAEGGEEPEAEAEEKEEEQKQTENIRDFDVDSKEKDVEEKAEMQGNEGESDDI